MRFHSARMEAISIAAVHFSGSTALPSAVTQLCSKSWVRTSRRTAVLAYPCSVSSARWAAIAARRCVLFELSGFVIKCGHLGINTHDLISKLCNRARCHILAGHAGML